VRLNAQTAALLPSQIVRPNYDPQAQKIGCVHFGIGAFHRAHQAVYTDDAMNGGDRDWGILGVSLRSPTIGEQLNPQDGLYTVAMRSGAQTDYRLIGAVRRVLVAPHEPQAVIAAVAAKTTHLVTFTITEKGYCRSKDGTLDPLLANQDSIYRFLCDGLSLRKKQGLSGLTLLSCDNLSANGRVLRQLFMTYLELHAPDLIHWVEAECSFPSSMVDRIVPATTSEDLSTSAQVLGMTDAGHVGTEPFSQWVIEDCFAGPRPRWEAFRAQLVDDVTPYETAKLRLLNGAHSALAYIGLLKEHSYVHEAVADPGIRAIIARLMHVEAAVSIQAAPNQDLDHYATALLARFENKALKHKLSQIAVDGSQKIPQRWLETRAWHKKRGINCPSIDTAIQAWFYHLRGMNGPVDDPRAQELAKLNLNQDLDAALVWMFGP
jgi:fructuronate reductase